MGVSGEQWRNLANTTEPSMFGFDAASVNYSDHHLLYFYSDVGSQRCLAVPCVITLAGELIQVRRL